MSESDTAECSVVSSENTVSKSVSCCLILSIGRGPGNYGVFGFGFPGGNKLAGWL